MPPREKFLQKGLEALSDRELIEILIGSGIKGSNFHVVAQSALSCIRRVLQKGADITLDALTTVDGLGSIKAMQLICSLELGKRLYQSTNENQHLIDSTRTAVSYFDEIKGKKREHVKALYLNARYELIHSEIISIGGIDRAELHPREVLTPALLCNAVYVLIGHNHPSGSVTPSETDRTTTERIFSACELLGIKLLDHIIVSANGWQSIDI